MFDPPAALERIIFKRWPALVFCQTPIDVAIDLGRKISDPATIRSVSVKTFAIAMRNGATTAAWHPTTRAGRTHSIPYCVATALLKPSVVYEDFDEPRASDPAVSRCWRISPLPRIRSQRGLSVKVRMRDRHFPIGRLDHSEIRDYPKGDPADPLSDAEIEDKFRRYFFFVQSPSEAGVIIERLWALDRQTDIEWLTSPLKRRMEGLPARHTNGGMTPC